MRYLSIKNLEKHQHYKDRRPPWIKLHAEVLDDYEFLCLQDASKAHLMLLWLLASKMDNRIPNDPVFLTEKLGATSPIMVQELIDQGFVTLSEDDSKPLAFRKQSAIAETETEAETQKQLHPAIADLKGFAFMGFLRPVWREVYGGDLPPGSAKRLKPTVGEHGVSEVARRLRIYCESTPATFASVPKFVSTFGTWGKQALQNGERMLGVGHEVTVEELASIGIKL